MRLEMMCPMARARLVALLAAMGAAGSFAVTAGGQNRPTTGASGTQAVPAACASCIYWANDGDGKNGNDKDANGTIGRANLDGSDPKQSFITGASGPWGVAVDGRYVYWTDSKSNTIGRANLDGDPASVNQSFIHGANEPEGVAVYGQHIYWANAGEDTIGRANLDGDPASVNQNFITGANGPFGAVVALVGATSDRASSRTAA